MKERERRYFLPCLSLMLSGFYTCCSHFLQQKVFHQATSNQSPTLEIGHKSILSLFLNLQLTCPFYSTSIPHFGFQWKNGRRAMVPCGFYLSLFPSLDSCSFSWNCCELLYIIFSFSSTSFHVMNNVVAYLLTNKGKYNHAPCVADDRLHLQQ